ncbi:hypothetical protein [Alteromonas phage ZP6]|uniref:Uncharacterized protein n=1 Tax=Alteromonas phage ZP6 TaxID=2492447 RepID=A0A3S9U8A8_9CAUD|nr:hypothetical protein PQC03_gp43 [Alteromonas phage ZP6]AZS06546.1 hypothetical protein [Alteromonas phage ZP6]
MRHFLFILAAALFCDALFDADFLSIVLWTVAGTPILLVLARVLMIKGE